MTTKPKKATAKKSVARKPAKAKSAPKEAPVKHAPLPGPTPNRQAVGWMNGQPIYED